ncbi:hypothetical protein L484_017544 [Morus notabilis]|uniref:Uncharacterized protein n=1 Tax=Morus notabilis TaxID=981085 RepID=W9R467_9ROSA|nr:hypothetical protein L484_017544 [Morus notabilis]
MVRIETKTLRKSPRERLQRIERANQCPPHVEGKYGPRSRSQTDVARELRWTKIARGRGRGGNDKCEGKDHPKAKAHIPPPPRLTQRMKI